MAGQGSGSMVGWQIPSLKSQKLLCKNVGMGQTDLALRQKAIPFQGQVFGYNSSQMSGQTVQSASDIGDLYFLTKQEPGNTLKYFPVRLLKPFYGDISQVYFTLDIKVGSSQAGPLGVYIGTPKWRNNSIAWGEFDEPAGVMEARTKAQHKLITGSDSPISANPGSRIRVTGLNLKPIIPQSTTPPDGSPKFFAVLLLFATAPDRQNGWEVTKFKIDAAVNVGL